MATGPHFDNRRGTYSVKWFDGSKWTTTKVYKVPGWKHGNPKPKRAPPEAMAAVMVFVEKERAARSKGMPRPYSTVASRNRRIPEFLSDYRAFCAQNQAARSVLQLDTVIRTFYRFLEFAKLEWLDEINPSVCQNYLVWRGQEISQKTGQPISP